MCFPRRPRPIPSAAAAVVLASLLSGCQQASSTAVKKPPSIPTLSAETPEPSPRLIIGRVIAIDGERGFAFVELVNDAPRTAFDTDNELIARTLELKETARLRVSRQLRGRTLGTTIVAGKPALGDEVVWLAP